MKGSGRGTGLVLAAIVAVGAGVRLYRLADRTFTHPEMFLPYMDLPAWATSPPAYDTLSELVTMVLTIDVHPPGFWAFMWGWMGVAGTGTFWIRIPLVVAGVASILLVYRLAAVDDGPVVGLVAAALLAVNGNHVLYAQIGRKYGLLVLLALLSTFLLRRLHTGRGGLRSRAGYVAVTASGVWFAHVFWFFLAGQVLWILAEGLRRGRFPRVLSSACAAAIAGSPGLFYMAHQWGRADYMEASPVPHLHELLMFGGLFQRGRLLEGDTHPAVVAGVALVTLAGAACLVAGVALRRGGRGWNPGGDPVDPGARALIREPAMATIVPAAFFAWNWTVVGYGASQLATLGIAGLAIPALLGLRRIWPDEGGGVGLQSAHERLVDDPVAFLLFAVAGSMSLVSVLGAPLAASRTMLFLGPFAAIVTARGIVALASTTPRRAAAAAFLGAVGVAAVVHVESRPAIHDYRALAEGMEPRLRAGDVVVVRDSWYTQPIHYHLPPGRVRTIRPEDLRRILVETRGDPGSRPERVWLVDFGEAPYLEPRIEELAAILEGYHRIGVVDAKAGRALLYLRREGPARVGGPG